LFASRSRHGSSKLLSEGASGGPQGTHQAIVFSPQEKATEQQAQPVSSDALEVPFNSRYLNDFFSKHPAFGDKAFGFAVSANKFTESVNEVAHSCIGEFPKDWVFLPKFFR
jgi:hypothetical protein